MARPTRDQVDKILADFDDGLTAPYAARMLVAEVRALRAELEQADHFGRGEFRVTQWAYDQALRVMREAKDEAAALAGRTPQPDEPDAIERSSRLLHLRQRLHEMLGFPHRIGFIADDDRLLDRVRAALARPTGGEQ